MKFLSKFLSRKLIVFIIGTVLLWNLKIDGWQWLGIAGIYLGMNSVDKFIRLKGGDNANN